MLHSQDKESDWSDICQVSTCLDQGVIDRGGATFYSEGTRTSHLNSSSSSDKMGITVSWTVPPKGVCYWEMS